MVNGSVPSGRANLQAPSRPTAAVRSGRTIGDENSALPSDLALGSVLVFIDLGFGDRLAETIALRVKPPVIAGLDHKAKFFS